MGNVVLTASKEDLDLTTGLSAKGMSAVEVADAIEKALMIQSSASEIDGSVNKDELRNQNIYARSIRKFMNLNGITITTNNGVTTTITPEKTLKIKLNNSVLVNTIFIDLANFGDNFTANENKNIGLKFRYTNREKLSYINVNLSSTTSMTDYYLNSKIQSTVLDKDGINYEVLYHKDFVATAGTPNTKSMNYLRLQIMPLSTNATGNDLEIELMEIVKFDKKVSKCMISFDDGHNSCMEIADLLDARGLKGTFYIYTDGIGESGNLTLAQVKDLHARGHDIAVHSKTHESVGTIGTDAYFANQQYARIWIKENIGPRAINHAALVGGISNDDLIDRMYNVGFESIRKAAPSGRFVHSGWGTTYENKNYFNPRFKGCVYEMNDVTTKETMINAHQYAIDNGMDFFTYGHQVKTIQTAQAWTNVVGNAYSMPDYFDFIKSKVDSGDVKVYTVSDFWKYSDK